MADAAAARPGVALVDLTGSAAARPRPTSSLCRRDRDGRTAAVCIHPDASQRWPAGCSRARRAPGDGGELPEGGEDILAAADETAAALAAGADEVDVVAPIAAVSDGDAGIVGELVEACAQRGPRGDDAEGDPRDRRSPRAGTDRRRRPSRGHGGRRFPQDLDRKAAVGGHAGSPAVLLAVCEEANGRVGFKAAGGIRPRATPPPIWWPTSSGPGWVSPRSFRFGASGLLDDLLRTLGRGDAAAGNGY